MRVKRNKQHKQADDMVSIAKQIKKEHKKQGIKLSKMELNDLVILKMNEGSDAKKVQEILDHSTVGQVHENIIKMSQFHIRKTKQVITDNRGVKIEQTIFTDFPIDANNY